MLTRRRLLQSSALIAVPLVLSPRLARADQKRLDVYYAGDSNIVDWWNNVVTPKFEAANPDYKINFVTTRTGGGMVQIGERALAALKVKADPQTDYLEEYDPRLPPGATEAGLWTTFSEKNVPSYRKLNPLAIQTPLTIPYRGSQVLFAYNSDKVKESEVPKTWPGLVAWIKAHPGQFIYNRPNKGGSGRNFVVRAIHEANGRNPSLFTVSNFTKQLADERLPKAWEILRDLAPHLYNGGAYTAGNTPTLQILASGAVSMITAWSDQALQGLAQGVLPPSIKLVQLQDLALCGGYVQSAIPVNAAHLEGALKLADFLLSTEIQTSILKDLGGFPSVSWDHLPADLKTRFADVIPTSIPIYPTGEWEAAMNDGWYRNVAPNIAP
ncbi:MAG: extracellular solute-binding protein [Proteobacteria bacterium]|nr:extracellular solute-binding protein [Pseudomonadota bacterium]